MSLRQVKLPDVGEGVTEAEIVAWHVSVGDAVSEDQNLLDVMTDKATVEMPSPVDGSIKAIHGSVGDVIAVGSVLVEIQIDGETASVEVDNLEPEVASEPAKAEQQDAGYSAPKPSHPKVSQSVDAADSAALAYATRQEGMPPLAAPATRRRAHELGIPLQYVPGTGRAGRITPADLEAFIARSEGAPLLSSNAVKRTGVQEVPVIGLRRKIAERMQDAKSRIPHFSYIEEFDLTALEELRAELNQDRKDAQPKLTLLPFFMRAMALLQPEFPDINAHYDDVTNVLHRHDGVHIGIATQTPGGLMVPVVRHTEALSIWDCARELGRVTKAARDGSAKREELTGSTVTLTSLGALGGIAATPVINSPEVGIIGPNKLVERPVVRRGTVMVRTMMNLSTSFDHRIVDGYVAASYVQRLKRLIERPALLFVEPI
ncbi:MAG: dihydrolipoamide acetyltransferase family protein [Pseudomonadota bacterium]